MGARYTGVRAMVEALQAADRAAPQQEDDMADRPRLFDDLAGVAGGALSALAGIRDEAEAMVRARVEETIRALDLVKRSELDAVMELAANARAGQEAAESRIAALEAAVAALQTAAAAPPAAESGGPGMIV